MDGPRGAKIRSLLKREQGEGLVVAEATQVEFAAFLRDLRDEGTPMESLGEIAATYTGMVASGLILTGDTEDAVGLVVNYPLEPAQAMVLAAAIGLRDRVRRNTALVPDPVLFLSLDSALRAAAEAEGFPVGP